MSTRSLEYSSDKQARKTSSETISSNKAAFATFSQRNNHERQGDRGFLNIFN